MTTNSFGYDTDIKDAIEERIVRADLERRGFSLSREWEGWQVMRGRVVVATAKSIWDVMMMVHEPGPLEMRALKARVKQIETMSMCRALVAMAGANL